METPSPGWTGHPLFGGFRLGAWEVYPALNQLRGPGGTRRTTGTVLVACTSVLMAKFYAHELELGQVNILFADGHAASLPTASMPKLTEAQFKGDDLSVFAKWPYPHFRLDQR